MDVALPDGTIIRGVPDGMSKADLTAKLKSNGYDVSKLEEPSLLSKIGQQAGNVAAGLLRGAGSIGAVLMASPDDLHTATFGKRANLSGLISGKEGPTAYEQNKQSMDDALQTMGAQPDSMAYKGGKLAGEIAGTAGAGGAVARGLAAVPGVAAAAPNLLNAIRTSGMTAGATGGVGNALTRAAGGAIAGGASAGLVDPGQIGAGAAIGGALPGAVQLVGAAGKAVGGSIQGLLEPLNNAGRNAIVGRALNRAAGSDAPAVATRLADAATSGQLVPGSLPTVGQAAGNAGVASLERAATATNPEMTNVMAERLVAQNAARVDLLRGMTGADGARDFAVANRAATSDQLYGAARANGIPPAALTPQAQANIAAMQARIPQSIIDDAKQLARIDGHPMNNSTSIEGLQYVKQGIDSAISKAKASGDATLAGKLTRLQSDFLNGLDQLSPDLMAARQTHAAMSAPINEMDVAQRIADRSIDPLTGTLRPSNFARNFNDRTAQQATGFDGSTLENTLSPANLNSLQALLADVQRSTAASNAAGTAGSDTVKKLAYSNLLDRAGIPNFLRDMRGPQIIGNLIGRAGDAIYAPANRDIQNRLAQVMLDPESAAALMRQATPTQRNALLSLLDSYGAPALAYRAAPVAATGSR